MRATRPAGTTAGASRLDASVRIEGADRAGLERLLRFITEAPSVKAILIHLGEPTSSGHRAGPPHTASFPRA